MKNKMDETVETYDNIVEEYIEYFNSKDMGGTFSFKKKLIFS